MLLKHYLTALPKKLEKQSETSRLDVQVLLGHVLGVDRAWLLAHPEADLTPEQEKRLMHAVARLEQGEPLPYVLGHWEFYGLDFIISKDVLIPRPETEFLVEQALRWLRDNPDCRFGVDVGTGSGCISVAISVNVEHLQMIACDISMAALKIAQRNLEVHAVSDRVHLVQADLLNAFQKSPFARPPFDFICANPPYIPTETLKTLKIFGSEPVGALDGGANGVETIRKLLFAARERLSPGGCLLVEIESSQGDVVYTLARSTFPTAKIRVLPDLAGHDRLLVVETTK